MLPDPRSLRDEAKKEIYAFIHKNFKPLPLNSEGSINELVEGFHNNDVDALRHAYVSGVFTMVYGEDFANVCGYFQEYVPGYGVSTPNGPDEINMDLWNNKVGRSYGKKSKNREELLNKLLKALKAGELIIDPNDSRKFKGAKKISKNTESMVVVVQQSNTGENEIFYDFKLKIFLNKDEFIFAIKEEKYPNYGIRIAHGKEIPFSKRDKTKTNNLG